MPRFAYIAVDASGVEKIGQLDAPDLPRVATALRGQGLFPTSVREATATERSRRASSRLFVGLRLGFPRGVGARERAAFTSQLATLLGAGVPLLRGLDVLARQERNPELHAIIVSLGETIKS